MKGYGGKDLQKKKVLSLEWKSEGVLGVRVLASMSSSSRDTTRDLLAVVYWNFWQL